MGLFRLSICAQPAFVAFLAGSATCGVVAALDVAAIAAIVLLVAARIALAFAKSDMTQARTGFAFAAPAAVAGYHAVHDITVAKMPQRAWQLSVSLFGAAIIATTFRIQWSRACR